MTPWVLAAALLLAGPMASVPVPVPGAPAAGLSLAAVRAQARGAPETAEALTFQHLAPARPVRKVAFLRGKAGEYLVAGDRAAAVEPTAAAPLFAPLTSLRQAEELVERFEPGERLSAAAAARLLARLEAAGLVGGPVAAPAALRPEEVAFPSGGRGYWVPLVVARHLAQGAELAVVHLTFTRDGGAARREESLAAVRAPPELAQEYLAGAPAVPADPAVAAARARHDARVAAFWDAVRAAR